MKNNNWKETTLGEVCKIASGSTPSTKEASFWDGEISWITPKDLSGFNSVFIEKGERNITKDGLKKSSAQILPTNTILFSSRAPIGYVAIAKKELTTNQGFKNIICDEKNTHYKYIYYWLKNRSSHIEKLSSGSTFSEASASLMRSLEISLPPIEEQKQIAAVLSSLDDKIELLRKQNETLEKIAQGIFKEWFVNFTIDGKKLKLKNSVPEGWRVGKLRDCIDFVIDNRGKTPPIIERLRDSVPMVEVNALTRESRIIDMDQCKKYVDQPTFNTWFRKGHPDTGDILISTVGSIGQLAQVFDEKICIAQNIIALRHAGFSNYLYGLLKDIQKEIISIDISSVQPSIKVPHLLNIEIFMPPKEIKVDFEKNIAPFSEKIHCNNSQIQTLSRLRDTLLPKLMSGETSVM